MDFKEVLKTLDLGEDIKDVEGFKKSFNEKFIAKAQIFEEEAVKEKIGATTGKITGAFATLAKREFDLTSDEINGKKWEDQLTLGVSKFKARIKELEDTVASGGDEKVKVLTTKLEKREKEFADLKGLLETTTQAVTLKDQELAKKEEEFGSKLKGFKAITLLDKSKEKLAPKLKEGMTEADKFFFDAKVNESFVIDFDDKDEILVLDKSGKRVQNPAKVGTFISLDEALEMKAVELGFNKKNNGGAGVEVGKLFNQNQNQNNTQNQQQTTATGGKVRTPHPSALKHAEQMKAQATK